MQAAAGKARHDLTTKICELGEVKHDNFSTSGKKGGCTTYLGVQESSQLESVEKKLGEAHPPRTR